ncbi:MAG: tyrosine--tRNA ligase [Gemmatimonadales bacterium]
MPTLLARLRARGFLHDATPGLDERLARGPITGYVGFDPTADSLHVGNLVPVMGLAWLQRTGGTPIAVVGGGTGMVGDPSGKRAERPVLSLEQIDANAARLHQQLQRFLSFEGDNAARMRNNADWLRGISLMEFLRDVGKHFTLSYMLQKESVRSRLETGISYTEFSYMLVQAYDFWHLFMEDRCELQLGGSDQWGNITAGIELIARREQAPAHGLVLPLITTTGGAKFGKSEEGNVWLDPEKTSPFRFYQFWLNTDDQDVERYLRFFTFLPLETIEEVVMLHREAPEKRHAQRVLAEDVTTRVHGADAAAKAVEASHALFNRSGDGGEPMPQLSDAIPQIPLPLASLEGGYKLVDALVQAGLASSKGDARRGLQGRGFYVNDLQEGNPDRSLGPEDIRADDKGNEYILLRKGKKNYKALVIRRNQD